MMQKYYNTYKQCDGGLSIAHLHSWSVMQHMSESIINIDVYAYHARHYIKWGIHEKEQEL